MTQITDHRPHHEDALHSKSFYDLFRVVLLPLAVNVVHIGFKGTCLRRKCRVLFQVGPSRSLSETILPDVMMPRRASVLTHEIESPSVSSEDVMVFVEVGVQAITTWHQRKTRFLVCNLGRPKTSKFGR